MIARRGFLIGLSAALAAPAIVRASSLMPVKRPPLITPARIIYGPHMFVSGISEDVHNGRYFARVDLTSSLSATFNGQPVQCGSFECTIEVARALGLGDSIMLDHLAERSSQ